MLDETTLRNLLSTKEIGDTDKLLLVLAVDTGGPKQVKSIKDIAFRNGLRKVKSWNVSLKLKRAADKAIRVDGGWEITASGGSYIAKIAGPLMSSPVPTVASSLRSHLVTIDSVATQNFVEESIRCFEAKQFRAAVVLSWIGAVSLLYDHVVSSELAKFNAEATLHFNKTKAIWKNARNQDDLARMKESDFLLMLEKSSIIGKSVKTQLIKCLDLRNGCGHPNSLAIADHIASSHIETLILNVFARY